MSKENTYLTIPLNPKKIFTSKLRAIDEEKTLSVDNLYKTYRVEVEMGITVFMTKFPEVKKEDIEYLFSTCVLENTILLYIKKQGD